MGNTGDRGQAEQSASVGADRWAGPGVLGVDATGLGGGDKEGGQGQSKSERRGFSASHRSGGVMC